MAGNQHTHERAARPDRWRNHTPGELGIRQRIEIRLIALGMTKAQMQRACGFPASSRWLLASELDRSLNTGNLAIMADVLGVPMAALVPGGPTAPLLELPYERLVVVDE